MPRWWSNMTAREVVRNASERAKALIQTHAQRRQDDVNDGLITPRLAALMVQQYSVGVLDTFTELFGERADASLRYFIDSQVNAIDSTWQVHAKERWAQRPADLA